MTKEQEDTLNMYEAVDSVLQTDENKAVWSGNGPFSRAVTHLEDNIDAIENLRDQQEDNIKGVTQDKQNKRQTLEEQTFSIASAVGFYASVNKNRKLFGKVKMTQTDLSRARDNELPGMSSRVHQAANDNNAALVAYGVTAGMITDLSAAIDDFVKDIGAPRAALTDTSAATKELVPVYEDTNKLLEEQLDKGMELFRLPAGNFYTQYGKARSIVNSPTGKRSLEVHFSNHDGGNALEHAKVTVDKNISRRSSTLGNIRVQNLTEGTHHLHASLPGFPDFDTDFNVINGETTKLTVKMAKV